MTNDQPAPRELTEEEHRQAERIMEDWRHRDTTMAEAVLRAMREGIAIGRAESAAPAPETPRTTDEAVAPATPEELAADPLMEDADYRKVSRRIDAERTMAAQPAAIRAAALFEASGFIEDRRSRYSDQHSDVATSLRFLAQDIRALAASPDAPVAQADALDAARLDAIDKIRKNASLMQRPEGFVMVVSGNWTIFPNIRALADAAIAAQADGAKA